MNRVSAAAAETDADLRVHAARAQCPRAEGGRARTAAARGAAWQIAHRTVGAVLLGRAGDQGDVTVGVGTAPAHRPAELVVGLSRAGHARRVLRDGLRAGAGQPGVGAVQHDRLTGVRQGVDAAERRADREVVLAVLVDVAGGHRVAELVAGHGGPGHAVTVLGDRARRAQGDVRVALVDRHVAAQDKPASVKLSHTSNPDVGLSVSCQPITRSGFWSPFTSPTAGMNAVTASSAAAEAVYMFLLPRTAFPSPFGSKTRPAFRACRADPGFLNVQKKASPGEVSTQSV